MKDTKLITIVIPVYNEAENIAAIVEEIIRINLKYNYEILFVNDGSSDRLTYKFLQEVTQKYSFVRYISFVKNFGHQLALKAGLDMAKGDCVISMDGDLQHPPSLLPEMIQKWEEGYEIVITKRINYGKVGIFKKISSFLYYKIINTLSSIPLKYGESDFRLLDKKVVDVFKKLNEIDLFLRGLTRWVGFKTTEITFNAEDRIHGKSKYSFNKMLRLAVNGIISFSSKPLYFSVYAGFICSGSSILILIYTLISLFSGHVVPGWSSTLIIISFFSGIQLIIMGIFGLYLSRIFIQSKNRPLYIIGENTYSESNEG